MSNRASLSPNQVASTVEGEQRAQLPVLPLLFIAVREYTTFAAEYAVTEGDLVFHFYVTDEVNKLTNPKVYWLERFPEILEPVVKEFFNADFPRVKAAYTEEKASWWLRAFGFGMVLDPHAFVDKFFNSLDAALEGAMTSST